MQMTSEVLKLAGDGADWYAKWLLHGLRTADLGLDPGTIPAFAGAEGLIHRDTNGIVGDLATVRDHLDVSARTDFDDGLTEAVKRLDLAQHEDVVLAKLLIRIASLVGNREAIHTLAFCLNPGRSDDDALDLNVEIVGGIIAHPYPNDMRSKDALYRLVRSASFKSNRAPQVLRALCAAAPADLLGHLVLLNRCLAPIYAPEKLQGNETRRTTACKLVTDIYGLVDAATFKAAIEKWDSRCTPEVGFGQLAFQQDWFVQVILRSPQLSLLAREADQITATHASQIDENNKQFAGQMWGVIVYIQKYISAMRGGIGSRSASDPGLQHQYGPRSMSNGWARNPEMAASDQEAQDVASDVMFGGPAS